MDFYYSEDIHEITSPQMALMCIHLLCLHGAGTIVYFDRSFHFSEGDLLVLSHPDAVTVLAPEPGCRGEFFAADYRFLQNQLPAHNYSIGGSISLHDNPVISLDAGQRHTFLDDIRRIRNRMEAGGHHFQREILGSLCLTMMYDIFDFHYGRDGDVPATVRAGYIVSEFMRMLSEGESRTHRTVSWYAEKLNVSEKYLSATVKRLTGGSVMSYIDRHTVPILKEYLKDPRLSLSQIADIMNFSSANYFTRYCTKHLGQTPGSYRNKVSKV